MLALAAVVLCAAPASLQLRHTGDPSCPDEAWLRAEVTARLGRSPFDPGADLVATTRVECKSAACEARLELEAPSTVKRQRTLTSPPGQCREVMESLALALAIALDPGLLMRPPPEAEADAGVADAQPAVAPAPPPPPEAPAPIVLVQAAPEPPPPPPSELGFQALLTGHGAMGLSPYPTGGLALAAGFRVRWLGVAVEGRFDAPRSVRVQSGATSGTVSSWVALGSLLGCGHWKGLGVCLQAGAGALVVTSDLPDALSQRSPLVLVGGRIQYEYMFLPWLGLHAHFTLLGVATRTTVASTAGPVWRTAPVCGDAGLGAVVQF